MIFHITSKTEYMKATESGLYFNPSLQSEGFIHFSTHDQVERTAKRFYHLQEGLVLLQIDPSKLKHELKYEPADGEDFPHLYGELNMDAVTGVEELIWENDQLVRRQQSS